MALFSSDFEVISKKEKIFRAKWLADYCFWSISIKLNNIHVRNPPPQKCRPICLQKTLFELERCSNVMIVSNGP